MKTPIAYYGGKQKLAGDIVRLMPEHECFVEVFGGGAAVLFKKPQAPNEVYNDIDGRLVNLFRMLRRRGDDLHRALSLTPYSRSEHACCTRDYSKITDELEQARCFFVQIRQSFGQMAGQTFSTSTNRQNARVWRNQVDLLPAAVARLREVTVEHLDFETLIDKYDRPDTFFYLDPPYVTDTRTSWLNSRAYRHEMSDEDHRRLVDCLRRIRGKALLSGYANDLYDDGLGRKWRRVFEKTMHCVSSRQSVRRTEVMWANYTP